MDGKFGKRRVEAKGDVVDELIGRLESVVKIPPGFPPPAREKVALGGAALPFYPQHGVARTSSGLGSRVVEPPTWYPGLPLPHGAMPYSMRPPQELGAVQPVAWYPGLPLPPGTLPNPIRPVGGAVHPSAWYTGFPLPPGTLPNPMRAAPRALSAQASTWYPGMPLPPGSGLAAVQLPWWTPGSSLPPPPLAPGCPPRPNPSDGVHSHAPYHQPWHATHTRPHSVPAHGVLPPSQQQSQPVLAAGHVALPPGYTHAPSSRASGLDQGQLALRAAARRRKKRRRAEGSYHNKEDDDNGELGKEKQGVGGEEESGVETE